MTKLPPEDSLPMLSCDLVDMLNEQYPHSCPSKDMTDRDIWIYTGKRELVDNLLSRKAIMEREEGLII